MIGARPREAVLPHPAASLIDGATGGVLRGAHLCAAVSAAAQPLAALPPGPVLALTPPTVPAVLTYLGAVQSHRPVAVLDPHLAPEALDELIRRYRPAAITGVGHRSEPLPPPGYTAAQWPLTGDVWVGGGCDTHPGLGLLLATSGSTGSPRLVRLGRRSVLRHTDVVARALGIGPDDITVTTVPLFHTYGLTVLNTHLARGGGVVLDGRGLADEGFWAVVRDQRVTSLAAVPYHFDILRRTGFDPADYPALRTITQAGGRLQPAAVVEFHDRMAAVDGRLVVMYGQTEAGRMAILPPHLLPAKAESAGEALPGGRFTVCDLDLRRPLPLGVTGELVYHGPNVMLGYADGAHDLTRGDDSGGVLHTGDLGCLDAAGAIFITGRINRISTVLGVRISLDDVEAMLSHRGVVAAVDDDDRVVVWAERAPADVRAAIRGELSTRTGLHTACFDVREVPALPLLPSGKVDYRRLEKMVG